MIYLECTVLFVVLVASLLVIARYWHTGVKNSPAGSLGFGWLSPEKMGTYKRAVMAGIGGAVASVTAQIQDAAGKIEVKDVLMSGVTLAVAIGLAELFHVYHKDYSEPEKGGDPSASGDGK